MLLMDQFVNSFRKQFIFQKVPIFSKKEKMYTTAYNHERKLKNDNWAMIVFIYLAPQYGFTKKQVLNELQISDSLYEILHNEIPELISRRCTDITLHRTIHDKAGLVRNHIRYTYRVKPNLLVEI